MMDLEILVLTPLQVEEGDNALITAVNVDVVLDYAKFGVRDSGVLFHVIEHPQHGKLSVDVWERPASRLLFTMLDLAKDKVRLGATAFHPDLCVKETLNFPGQATRNLSQRMCSGALSARRFGEPPGQRRVGAGAGPRTRVCAAELSAGAPPLCPARERDAGQRPSRPQLATRGRDQAGSGGYKVHWLCTIAHFTMTYSVVAT